MGSYLISLFFPSVVDQIGLSILCSGFVVLQADPAILISLFLFYGLSYSYNWCSPPLWICGLMLGIWTDLSTMMIMIPEP